MHIQSSHPALSGRLIDAGIALAQEVQDIVDQAVDSAGGADPEPSSATAFALSLVEEWEEAYAEHNHVATDRFSGNRVIPAAAAAHDATLLAIARRMAEASQSLLDLYDPDGERSDDAEMDLQAALVDWTRWNLVHQGQQRLDLDPINQEPT
jgi:hypothetical protein